MIKLLKSLGFNSFILLFWDNQYLNPLLSDKDSIPWPNLLIEVLRLSIKYIPLVVSRIDHLLVHPAFSVIYLLPSTLPLLAISIGTPWTVYNLVLELNNISSIPLSWKA